MLYAANEMIGCPWSFYSNPLSFGFGQPCSSSCCGRNWSIYIFVHSLRRNKITPQRVKDLMFIHNNLRLLSRKMSIYKEGETKMWVVHEDGFDTMNMKNAGLLEVANLSFDELELEAIMFSNNNEEMLEDVLGSFSVGMLGRALLNLGPPYSGDSSLCCPLFMS